MSGAYGRPPPTNASIVVPQPAVSNAAPTTGAITTFSHVHVDVANAGSQTWSPNTGSIIPGSSVPVATTVAAPTASDVTTVNGSTSDPISAAPTPTPTVPASIGATGSPSQSVHVQPGMPLEHAEILAFSHFKHNQIRVLSRNRFTRLYHEE